MPADQYPPFPQDIDAPTPAASKKPRHRHSPPQLAALNELFDQNEHPPLEQRTALAERLGMETKTVNAWFQNKRASSKKRVRGGGAAAYESQSINSNPLPPLPPATRPPPMNDFHRPDLDDIPDDDFDVQHSRSASVTPSDYHASFHANHPDQAHFYGDSEGLPRKLRMRPSNEQTEELKKLYNINPHPTTEQRQALAAAIGMRYQSITNWFQNQRSLAKKKREDEGESMHTTNIVPLAAPKAEYPHETRQYSAFPPPSHPHPSLGLPPPTSHPSLMQASMSRRSRSLSPTMDDRSPRRSFSRRSTTPYSSAPTGFSRPRRSRPEPYQLEALKELFRKTATPTIEERSALALEIGMDVGKVTNWFRNLRQTARKRAKKTGSGEDIDEDDDSFHGQDPYSASVSRSGTPSFGSSSSSFKDDDSMDMDDYNVHSADNSEDEYQEAVTPSPEPSPSPPPTAVSHPPSRLEPPSFSDQPYPIQLDKASEQRFAGIKVEDALLLLMFHRHIVH